jgi:hypothetical protein
MKHDIAFSLADDERAEQLVECRCDGSTLRVHADGYGVGGDLVRLEHRDGRLVLLVWADVNDDEPTHVIDLESALQEHRNEVIAEAKERLCNETLSPVKEGRLFLGVYESINRRTGRQFTVKEAAAELGVTYVRFRNSLMLVMPIVPASLTDEDRKRLLEAPADPSGLRKLLFGERK